MPFNQNDIYTSSGSVQLFNEWIPYVSKFDTSSWYNWEQDNLPLYDLEERTYELWEQNGYNTSANVPGLALTVSADTPALTLQQNRNIFTDLSSCIAAIPKVVRFPVLVEVGNFGDLGALELHNFRIEEGGSVEIINRAFSRVYNASSTVQGVLTPTNNASISLTSSIASTDLTTSINQTSCVHLGVGVLSATTDGTDVNDTRFTGNTNTVLYPRHNQRKGATSVSIGRTFLGTGIGNNYEVTPYEEAGSLLDDTMATLDISGVRQIDSASNFRTGHANSDAVGGNVYFNKVSKISVKNCDGPVYIRNFFADAETVGRVAIEVTNSDVVLENCTGLRAQEAGFEFNSSKVVLSRTAMAYRNYNLLTTSTRQAEVGAGFLANNSTITVSSLAVSGGSTAVGDNGALGEDCVVVASRNTKGFVLNNSTLLGGVERSNFTDSTTGSVIAAELNTEAGFELFNSVVDAEGLLEAYLNSVGFNSSNSNVRFQSICVDAHNQEGVLSKTSDFIFDAPATYGASQTDRKQLDFSGNGQHIVLDKGSEFGLGFKDHMPEMYGNSKFQRSHGALLGTGFTESLPSISVRSNSKLSLIHANILVNSNADTNFTRAVYGRAVEVRDNSEARFYGSKNGSTFILGPVLQSTQINCAGVFAGNNSKVALHGPTVLAQFGVDALAENNSIIDIEPPRKIGKTLAITEFDLSARGNHTSVELHSTRACLVANKNSTINLEDLGSYVSNWSRGSTSSILADGSDYDISLDENYISSGSLQFYPNPQDDTVISQNQLNNVETGLSLDAPVFTELNGVNRLLVDSEILNTSYTNDLQGTTLGGVAVRATNDSQVNVKNVHFPIATNNSPLDGKYFDVSGSLCDRFIIWNIADSSRLHSSYTSVSGLHPADTSYHGPSSFWSSSLDGTSTAEVPAYGAPSSTPDTGSLSILDAFGAGSSVLIIPSGVDYNTPFDRFQKITGSETASEIAAIQEAGINYSGTNTYHWGTPVGTAKNQGPFRIYWSPKPSARVLMTDVSGFYQGADNPATFSGIVGPAYQLFAQGYNCSAPVSAVPATGESNASSVYPDLLKLQTDSNTLWTSGYYYCSEMVEDNPNQCILDESSARTFANSQHASLGLGGTSKKVTIYRSRGTSDTGSESFEYTNPGPVGFKSASIFDLSRDN